MADWWSEVWQGTPHEFIESALAAAHNYIGDWEKRLDKASRQGLFRPKLKPEEEPEGLKQNRAHLADFKSRLPEITQCLAQLKDPSPYPGDYLTLDAIRLAIHSFPNLINVQLKPMFVADPLAYLSYHFWCDPRWCDPRLKLPIKDTGLAYAYKHLLHCKLLHDRNLLEQRQEQLAAQLVERHRQTWDETSTEELHHQRAELERLGISLGESRRHSSAEYAALLTVVEQLEQLAPDADPLPLDRQQQRYCQFRLLPHPDDQVNSEQTRAWLDGMARSNPGRLTFCLVATDTEIYPLIEVAQQFAPDFERQFNSYFHQSVLEAHPWDDFPTHATARSSYSTVGPDSLLNTFNLTPDPYQVFCTLAERLQPSETLLLAISFTPAPPQFQHRQVEDATAPLKKKLSQTQWTATIETLAGLPAPAPPETDSPAATRDRKERAAHLCAVVAQQFLNQYSSSPENQLLLWNRRAKHELSSVLSTDELAGLVHVPHKSINSQLLLRANMQSQKPPDELTQANGLLLGENEYRRQRTLIRLPHEWRSQHLYTLGASGSGKSTLLLNLIAQDIEAGRGCAVIDPHGDLVADTLARIPKERISDTVYINMADVDEPVSLNPFDVPASERAQAADEFVLVFERMFLSDAARAKHILYFTIAALLEAGNTTPLDIENFLTSPRFRNSILQRLKTPRLIRFVEEEFEDKYSKAVDPIVNKLARFSMKPEVSALLGQPKSKLNLYQLMQEKKILLLKLMPERQEDSDLIGGLLVCQLQLAAMRRNQLPPEKRISFSLYIDEFQNFMAGGAEAFSKILSEARKYNLCLVLAHQYIGQIDDSVRQAIFANARSQVFFRTSPQDAQAIRLQLGSFTPEQVTGFAMGQALVSVSGTGPPFVMRTFPPPARRPQDCTAEIIEHSRRAYAFTEQPNPTSATKPAPAAEEQPSEQAAAEALAEAARPINERLHVVWDKKKSHPPPAAEPAEPPPASNATNPLDDIFGNQ
jgi:hypothetical protein